MSIGLNSNFNRGQSQNAPHMLTSIDNPLNELAKSAQKPSTLAEEIQAKRDCSNSQRSFRIRKYVRSISRGSNQSNLSHDHVN
jgi:hypothetical protein